MVVAPISVCTTLNRPAMPRAASAALGCESSEASPACSATAEITDMRCDLPVP